MYNGTRLPFRGIGHARNGSCKLKKRILISIVDDDQWVRDAMGDLVESLGYGALKFSSAEHFLESGRIAESACLITDLQMPGLNGLDLQQRLLAQGYDTPVIFITASPEKQFEDRAQNAGAVALLSKPFDDKVFVNCIQTALNGRAG
jgi:FixJ family two-component response regulator